MVDVDTFLTTLYVIVDDFCQSRPPRKRPGPQAALSDSEVITLAIFARWARFRSERDFFRYAQSCLREAFPTLPDRSQFNRLVRSCVDLIEEVALAPAEAYARYARRSILRSSGRFSPARSQREAKR